MHSLPRTETTSELLGLQPEGRLLVANAHGDDESMWEGETIRRLVKAGRYVVGATATDGEQRGDPTIRRQEVSTAFEALGIPKTHSEFFGIPDAELYTLTNALLLTAKIGQVAARHSITTILTPAWAGTE